MHCEPAKFSCSCLNHTCIEMYVVWNNGLNKGPDFPNKTLAKEYAERYVAGFYRINRVLLGKMNATHNIPCSPITPDKEAIQDKYDPYLDLDGGSWGCPAFGCV